MSNEHDKESGQTIENLEVKVEHLKQLLDKTIKYSEADPEVFLSQARKTAEAICRAIYEREKSAGTGISGMRKRAMLDDMIQVLTRYDLVPIHMQVHLRTIQGFGNYGTHDQSDNFEVSTQYIQPCLMALTTFTYWYFNDYLGRRESNPLRGVSSNTAPKIQIADSRIHEVRFIIPTNSRNDYYFDIQNRLSMLVNDLQTHKLVIESPDSDHYEDMYLSLAKAIRQTGPEDSIIVVPRDLDQPGVLDLVADVADRCKGRLIFFDQAPPENFLASSNRYFVGADNLAVGFLAAAGLKTRTARTTRDVSYLVLAGPGGHLRRDGFVSAVRHLANTETLIENIEDLDRFENIDQIDELIDSLDPERAWAIFAGNDENALALLASLENSNIEEFVVAGCDATKEMRFKIDRNPDLPLCTVDILPERQCSRLVHVVQVGGKQQVVMQEPALFPVDRRIKRELRKFLESKTSHVPQ